MLPLSRVSCSDIARAVQRSRLVATISDKTVWSWLSEDAMRPWQHRCWIFPRDPDFAVKAARILDLYGRRWKSKPLGRRDFVISTDEKTSIQARRRLHPTLPPGAQRAMRVEHEYVLNRFRRASEASDRVLNGFRMPSDARIAC